jgi:methyl-accepting chemotaxis protein
MISFYKNLKISSKIISLLGILGFFVLATTVFTTAKMHAIDDTYSILLSKDAKGAVLVMKLNARLLDTGRLMYMLVAETDVAKMQGIDKDITADADKLRDYAATAKSLLPNKAAEITESMQAFETVIKASADIRSKAMANDNAVAMRMMREQFEPGLAALRKSMNDLAQATQDGVDKASDAATEETNTTIKLTYLAIGIGLAVILTGATMISSRFLSQPIVAIAEVMHRLAARDYTVVIAGTERQDEVGRMALAVQVFKDGMVRADAAAAEEETHRMERERRAQRIEAMTHDFDTSVSKILTAVADAGTEMHSTASSMSATAEQTTRQASIVASAAEEASANVQTVAAASEELASSIQEISRQVNQSAQVAANAAKQSTQTNDLMLGLAQSAQRIGEVVGLINNIASQTNLLALNATIEAARAGEAGKGFAVVANEVKTLANQTGKATDEIAQQVTAVQTATEEAVKAIQGIGLTISEINEISAAIASAVEEQGAATQEIARNVQQAAEGTQEVTQNIGGVSDAATETGHSAHSVLNAATGLSRESTTLRRIVDGFLKDVRAA